MDGICKLHQHEEQLSDFKADMKEIRATVLGFDLKPTDTLVEEQTSVESAIFDCSLAIKR